MVPDFPSLPTLGRKTTLESSESVAVSLLLQTAALERLFDADGLHAGEVVFHGGTSIRLLHSSVRFSEDLDFMLVHQRVEDLPALMAAVARGVQEDIQPILPGSKIELKAKASKSVRGYELRWSHDDKMGVVKMKVEFLPVPRPRLDGYAWAPQQLMVRDSQLGVRLGPIVSAASLDGLYGDKIVALAFREYPKHRDIFDLYFLKDLAAKSDHRLPGAAALGSAAIYSYSPDELVAKISARLDDEALWRPEEFAADMRRWLPEKTYNAYARAGAPPLGFFPQMIAAARQSLSDAREVAENHLHTLHAPAPDDELPEEQGDGIAPHP